MSLLVKTKMIANGVIETAAVPSRPRVYMDGMTTRSKATVSDKIEREDEEEIVEHYRETYLRFRILGLLEFRI